MVKQIKIHLKLLKCLIQILPKFLLCILKCHWLEIFCFEFFSQFTASLTAGHQIYKIYPFFRRQVHLPFQHNILLKNQLKFTQFSIPNTPGHLNTHVIIVNVYRSMCISEQSLSSNVPVSIHTELIGQLSVSVYLHVQINLIG